ncbi:hypothetical protein [Hymenobacter siberiensis]|jgi:hypothetical protein|uniref:hypothetical protein n=1 Tax=Hymenobacter siberiensis TaxID=2848396 RepID=UPI001C1E5493|nr:hypothetical protein [Hymenobacter siberiensis]MBU6120643.1 hypothetical protein [Hymenobacter siberiensis]
MKKTKDKAAKNKSAKKQSLLGGAAKSLKKLRKSKLTTTQKVLAGAALAAVGLSMLAKRNGKNGAEISSDTAAAEDNLAAMDANA